MFQFSGPSFGTSVSSGYRFRKCNEGFEFLADVLFFGVSSLVAQVCGRTWMFRAFVVPLLLPLSEV